MAGEARDVGLDPRHVRLAEGDPHVFDIVRRLLVLAALEMDGGPGPVLVASNVWACGRLHLPDRLIGRRHRLRKASDLREGEGEPDPRAE